MPKKKKPFIDKKHATTFSLVHRSQRDPLVADDEAPEHVLLPNNLEKQKQDERAYGIFYDDDYNYLQHLRDADEVADEILERVRIEANPEKVMEQKLNLPSSVFGSNVETEIGLLNKAAPSHDPKFDWDPEIVETLDENFTFDELEALPDNFIQLANENENMEEDNSSDEVSSTFSDQMEDTKSHFTEYSMSSSILPRNKGLQLVDDHFEKFYENYDDVEIGALDFDDIDGAINPISSRLQQLIEDYRTEKELKKEKEALQAETKTEEYVEDSENEEMVTVDMEKKGADWDCESILSTYSNLYNHPTKILEPSSNRKEKKKSKGLTLEELRSEIHDSERPGHFTDTSKARPKNETPEEKKERKSAIKMQRKERRVEKKTNKEAFKTEKLRTELESIRIGHFQNGIKLS